MKNPKPNQEIEAIKNRLKQQLLPEGNIPNSRVAKMVELLDATATLEYAKKLNRPVRKAREGECQYTIELEKQRSKNPKQENIGNGLLNAKEASKELGITTKNIQHHRRSGKLKCTKIGGRFFFKREDVERLRIQRAIDKL
ncbi:helix-turn-helix domain-containing protein [Chryseobacterium sp. ON_d1]|uniref:helix-turn-helix domain-containing protein n=1 Tax=Chryseobacterium sp. ON_d1 TaxID=2583211 RepID=UPI001157E94F|nr:helix-turn-helix domain-containing protein [Chryseobacterium sp. ON_d1]GEJ46053.1 hypothetical protein CRS_26610 [Chryseobacterium sp. ON_d1]